QGARGLIGERHAEIPSQSQGQRQGNRGLGRAAHAADPFPARAIKSHRPAYWLRYEPLRRLHGRPERQIGEVLHRIRRAGERRGGDDHRGRRRRRRHAACVARRLSGDARLAMRLLHAGHDHPRVSPAAGESEPDGRGNPLRHRRQPLPLYRLPEHRQGDSIRRGQACRRTVPGGRRMNDQTPTSIERAEKLQGMGCKRKRVEDVRFVQGRGNYVDDLKLPGMLYGDVQMVVADGKVLFQNQEVAFVIAEDRYVAADAAELVEVEYEPLPVVIDPMKAMSPGAPVVREDIKDKPTGAHGKRKHYNHIFSWQAGDKAASDAAFEKADVTIKELIVYPRCHPCPLETCQCVASFDKTKGELTLWGTFQAPHVIRTVGSLISKIPEHKIHVIAPDIGGGFGNKVGAYSGYICAIVASIVTGRPVKWVEDRIENLSTTAFARDFHMMTEIAATRDGRVTGLRCYTIADHGAF